MKIIMKWQCEFCGDVVTSTSSLHYAMDTCSCGKTSIDLEEHYMRQTGKYKVLERITEHTNGKREIEIHE
jgi:hypothetical protein